MGSSKRQRTESSDASSSSEEESKTTPIPVAITSNKKLKMHKKTHRESSSSDSSADESVHDTFKSKRGHNDQKLPGISKESKKQKVADASVSAALPSEATAARQQPKLESRQNSDQAETVASINDSASLLVAEIICDIADFANNLARKISTKAGYQWTPQTDDSKRKIKRIKDPNEPRRRPNSYTIWSEHIRKKLKELDANRTLTMAELSELWKKVGPEQKAQWEEAARIEKENYIKQMENYRATRTPTKGNLLNIN